MQTQVLYPERTLARRPAASASVAMVAMIAKVAMVAMFGFAAFPAHAAQDRLDQRISDMHAKLMITAAQEAQWAKVTQVMRDNETTIAPLIRDRTGASGTMNAIDDLKSYGAILDAHADGARKFIPVFSDLYDSMSDGQKKAADALFQHTNSATRTRK